MNKEFEKILERLNEMIHPKQLYFCKYAKGECKHLDNDDKNCAECTVELAKEIVQEVAEEYTSTEHINCSTNTSTDGWILCSERLPEDDSFCIVTVEYPNNKTMVDYGWFDRKIVCWFVGMQEFRTSNILAWQPLPEPFKDRD